MPPFVLLCFCYSEYVTGNPFLQISGQTVGQVKTVSDMHERKAEMAREAEAFIALPGNY